MENSTESTTLYRNTKNIIKDFWKNGLLKHFTTKAFAAIENTEEANHHNRLNYIIGFKDRRLVMIDRFIDEVAKHKVSPWPVPDATFHTTVGTLHIGTEYPEGTLLFEIDYKESLESDVSLHSNLLPEKYDTVLNKRQLRDELQKKYMEKAHEIAIKTIEQHGWKLVNHINSYPIFQAFVTARNN